MLHFASIPVTDIIVYFLWEGRYIVYQNMFRSHAGKIFGSEFVDPGPFIGNKINDFEYLS
jgi:hypothetical protein